MQVAKTADIDYERSQSATKKLFSITCDPMKIDRLTPTTAILRELGGRLAQIRKQQGFSQEDLAAAAGVGVATLRRIEDGKDGRLGSWLRLLLSLQMEGAVEQLLPADFRSPMAEVKGRRARRKHPPSPTDDRRPGGGPDTGGGPAPEADDTAGRGFVWGDQRP